MYSCLVHLISQPSVRSGLSFGGEGGVGKSFKNCKHRERHIYFYVCTLFKFVEVT